jgi:hypothetical protein
MSGFERLPRRAAGGVKLCGRRTVNPSLTFERAMDPARFLRGLRARLGEPDPRGDSLYSYSVRDTVTGVEFEAYSAQSGPAYGGRMHYFTDEPPGQVREDVLDALTRFDPWVEAAAGEG